MSTKVRYVLRRREEAKAKPKPVKAAKAKAVKVESQSVSDDGQYEFYSTTYKKEPEAE